MKLAISVIICTHNPRRDYLDKVLVALKSQALGLEQWELLLIDNASERLLSSEIDLSWHPNARHIREEQLGLTPARLRGIRGAKSETLIFVDDDNVLDANYLEEAWQIANNWPMLGAWGGQARPDFEVSPPEWTKPYWECLAIREFDRDSWSNLLHQTQTVPYGAGLCVRKVVAEKYAELTNNHPLRANLDRKSNLLLSGGDLDLALTSCEIGLGTGRFVSLKLTHLIPAFRLQEDYLLKLVEGMGYSNIILDYIWAKPISSPSWKSKLRLYIHPQRWLRGRRSRRFDDAYRRGCNLAVKAVKELVKKI